MLRPHLLLTFLVFVALCAYGTHFFSQRRTSWPSPSSTSADTNGSAGSSAGTSGTVEPSRPIGPPGSNGQSNKQAYNDDDQDRTDSSDENRNQQNVPGQFDYYALVLSWSPTYCADDGRDDDTQCNRRDGWRYSFVLHGLWPQYESGYPSNCRLPRRPFVPDQVINSMLDIMPSRGLVIHEYRTHGTCSGMDPMSYFTTAHRLFDRINIPERFRNPFEPQILSALDVQRAFLEANPQFRPNMIAVAWLRAERDAAQSLHGQSSFRSADAFDGQNLEERAADPVADAAEEQFGRWRSSSRSADELRLRSPHAMIRFLD
jgi:ribonuclease T2